MKRIFVPTESGSDWQKLLAKPKLHWKAGRSAMSAAASWETHAPYLPSEIVEVLSMAGDESLRDLDLIAAIPEWEVELPGGDRPSQTDILAITRNDIGLVILGVEAKVDEPFGPTLKEKRQNASKGQLERIAYLEDCLGCEQPLDDGIRYQLMHRTVSALIVAQQFYAPIAVMLVQSFSPESKWRSDFDTFSKAVLSNSLTPDLHELPTQGGTRLLVGWCTGSDEFRSMELPGAV